jgi:hypothetical protein
MTDEQTKIVVGGLFLYACAWGLIVVLLWLFL